MFAILPKGDKKQLFSEFCSQIHRKRKEEMRRKKGMVGELMNRELMAWKELNYATVYEDVARKFHKSEWWDWADEQTRDGIFQEFMEREEGRLKRKRKESKICAMDKLIDLMTKDYGEELKPWHSVKAKYLNFEGLSSIDVLNCHKYVFKEVYAKRYKEAQKSAYRLQRKIREKFMAFLKVGAGDAQECAERGEIDADTKFADFIAKHASEAVYVDLVGQPGSTPVDLFTELKESLRVGGREGRGINV